MPFMTLMSQVLLDTGFRLLYNFHSHTTSILLTRTKSATLLLCISVPRLAQLPCLFPFYELYDTIVANTLWHWFPATVQLSLSHTTSVLLTRTKLYGYSTIGLYCLVPGDALSKPAGSVASVPTHSNVPLPHDSCSEGKSVHSISTWLCEQWAC
jgi:hypothetical protein